MKPICLDTSGWIEIAVDGDNARRFSKALSSSAPLIVSAVSIYEIAKYTTREAGEQAAADLLTFMRQYQVVEIDVDLSIAAATISAKHQLAMADALIYTTASTHSATLWTQDENFKSLPHVKYFPKTKAS